MLVDNDATSETNFSSLIHNNLGIKSNIDFFVKKCHNDINIKIQYIAFFVYLLTKLQSFSQFYDLASNTTHVVCANFIHE